MSITEVTYGSKYSGLYRQVMYIRTYNFVDVWCFLRLMAINEVAHVSDYTHTGPIGGPDAEVAYHYTGVP